MQILLGLLLFVGVVIMITLIFIGYFLYLNSKRTSNINDRLSAKEADLIELYDSLELMMEEIEKYTKQSKEELQQDIEKIKNMQQDLKELKESQLTPDVEENNITKLIPLNDKMHKEKEKLFTHYEKCIDIKGNKVRAYFNKGVPISEIARDMGIGKGEVQLILNLKKNKII